MKIENKKLIIETKDLENLSSLHWKLLNLKNYSLQNIEYIEVKDKLFHLKKKSLFEISNILNLNFYTRKT